MWLVYLIVALILGGIGWLFIAYPEDMIYLFHQRRFESFEPTEEYIGVFRFGGFMLALVGVVFVVLAIAKLF